MPLGDPLRLLPSAAQASFNAIGKEDHPLCLPDTRTEILEQIRTWANADDGKYIFWLSGWAGTGKSTIARTIAREYYNKACGVSSFFFSRGGGDVSHAAKFVGSIAAQLAQKSPGFKDLLQKAISNDSGIVNRILKDQWKELILQPLSKMEASSLPTPLLIVIDALDECEKESDIKQVLQLLSDARSLTRINLRILITSRPEIPIRHGFSQIPDGEYQDFVLHEISGPIVDHDISLFLERSLAIIRQKWGLARDWPGEQTIRHLVRKAAGLFIWAATAFRFVDEGGELFGPERLSDILDSDNSVSEPEEELNKIYTKVLENSISPRLRPQEKEIFCNLLRDALGVIVLLFSPLAVHSLAAFLHTPKQKVDAILRHLHSILDIPKDSRRPVRLLHPSLRDFLLDPQRCRDLHFWVDEKKAQGAVANHCIQLMSEKLKRDICGLNAPGAQITEVPPDRKKHCLTAELQYACQYWVQHLQRSKTQLLDDGQVHMFLREHLLHWLEALSLMRKTAEGVLAIISLDSMIMVSQAIVNLGSS